MIDYGYCCWVAIAVSGVHCHCRTAVPFKDVLISIYREISVHQSVLEYVLLVQLIKIQQVSLRSKCGIYLIVAVITGYVFIIALIMSTFFLRRSCLKLAECWGLDTFLRYATTASDWTATLGPCRPSAVDSPEGSNLEAWCQHARMPGCSLWQPPSGRQQLHTQPRLPRFTPLQTSCLGFSLPRLSCYRKEKQKQRDKKPTS